MDRFNHELVGRMTACVCACVWCALVPVECRGQCSVPSFMAFSFELESNQT